MRLWQKTGLVALIVVLAAGATLWWLPARWALPWLQRSLPGLRLQQVAGTLWNGRAGHVLADDGEVLGRAQWRLSRMALLGRSQLWLDVTGSRLDLRGEVRRLVDDEVEWRNVAARVDLAVLSDPKRRLLPLRLRGELALRTSRVLLQGGWPRDGEVVLVWRNAALKTRFGDVALGHLDAQVMAQDGIVHAQWHATEDSPLRARGTLAASPLGWRAQAELQARADAPLLQRWLASLGRPDASGILHLERHGGLAAAPLPEKAAP